MIGDTSSEGMSGADVSVDGVGALVPPCGVISSIACPLFCCTVFPLLEFLGAVFSLPENKHDNAFTYTYIYTSYMHII